MKKIIMMLSIFAVSLSAGVQMRFLQCVATNKVYDLKSHKLGQDVRYGDLRFFGVMFRPGQMIQFKDRRYDSKPIILMPSQKNNVLTINGVGYTQYLLPNGSTFLEMFIPENSESDDEMVIWYHFPIPSWSGGDLMLQMKCLYLY